MESKPNQDVTARKRREEFVAKHKKWLVERGDEIGKKAKDNPEWTSQARSIWEAARTESEPLVLLNLLRYQSARNRNWRSPEDVFTPLQEAIQNCIDTARGDGQGEEGALDLIRHLMVYTIRSHTFHNKFFRSREGRS